MHHHEVVPFVPFRFPSLQVMGDKGRRAKRPGLTLLYGEDRVLETLMYVDLHKANPIVNILF